MNNETVKHCLHELTAVERKISCKLLIITKIFA